MCEMMKTEGIGSWSGGDEAERLLCEADTTTEPATVEI